MCCSSPCFLVFLCTHHGLFQSFSTQFRKLKEIRALQPVFPDYVISCDYGQEFHCYQFLIKLDRCLRSCNTHIVLSNKVCVPNKTRFKYKWVQHDARINESKILIKHVSCICKCEFDGRRRNRNQCRNIDKYRCEGKKRYTCEKDYTWNLATCICRNRKYLANIIDNSVIAYCEIIVAQAKSKVNTKVIPINFN